MTTESGRRPSTAAGDPVKAAERLPLLLEIGSEEIPARFIPESRRELEARAAALLDDLHLAHGALRTLATPRRLALLVDAVALRQPDRELEIKGPPLSVAYDGEGRPTQAALGFARKAGVDLDACERGEDARGQHLLARRVESGQPAVTVLAERLPGLILSIPFRKVMRWGELEIEYARPLQWLVALLGTEVIPFTLGATSSGRVTRGHRTLSGDAHAEVAAPDTYEGLLADLGVVVDPARRELVIRDGMTRTAAALGGVWREDDELLSEVVHLCEHPTVFAGSFEEHFFEVPPEVIVTALKAHQRYFAVDRADGGGLLPRFLSVRDGAAEHLENVVAGNERVLRARLSDALFYWRFDQRRSPEQHAAALDSVTWLEGFGSVGDKGRRVAALVRSVWETGLGTGEAPPPQLDRAARLAKFDLVTEMIKDGKEFTRLEGIIGARYAEAAGEDPVVCRAIEDHYRPRGAADSLPPDPVSATLSVADRLDTLAGCWLAGFCPTGAKDPYALRRHALAVVRILVDRGARLDLDSLLERALAAHAEQVDGDPQAVRGDLLEFVRTRLEGYLVDAQGMDPDVVRAVLPAHGQDPYDALAWARALSGFRDQKDFQRLATGFKRCRNILQGDVLPAGERPASRQRWEEGGRGAGGESFGDLVEPAETALRDRVAMDTPALRVAAAQRDYEAVFRLLAGFGPAIDAFFDQVRVNVEEPRLRRLRHAFLREIHALFASFADFVAVAPAD
ncbi:MAG: glycine--tRNA ligase subunit beta [Candidatus Krumholzibacteriia bacterium]